MKDSPKTPPPGNDFPSNKVEDGVGIWGNMSDRDLLRAYVDRKDREMLGSFVTRHQALVLRFATGFLGDAEAAQDVAQETFLQVARYPRRLLQVDSCPNWLLRVARNLGVDHLRRVMRRRALAKRVAERAPEPRAQAPPEGLERAEMLERVRGHIAELPPRQRELILLRVQEQKSYREIAAITGLTATNVGYILHQAMKSLKARI